MHETPPAAGAAPDAPPPAREPYEAPRIEEVKIVPGEALLGFCKTTGRQGAFSQCGNPACQGAGS
jgi:hypothetical protein